MVSGTMDLSPAQWGELGPLWRRNMGSPKYEISARASPVGEEFLRQVLGMEPIEA